MMEAFSEEEVVPRQTGVEREERGDLQEGRTEGGSFFWNSPNIHHQV